MTFSVLDDFATITDGLQAVTLDRLGSSEDTAIAHALRRAVTHKEIEAGDGSTLMSDVQWNLSQVECVERPDLGDAIEDADGERWVVMSVVDATLSGRWVCLSRNMRATFGLDDEITIEKASYAKGDSGALVATWTTHKIIRGRVQPSTAAMAIDGEANVTERRYDVILGENVDFGPHHRMKDAAGNVYRVLASASENQIGQPQLVTVEAW
jgi:hypothetical protein